MILMVLKGIATASGDERHLLVVGITEQGYRNLLRGQLYNADGPQIGLPEELEILVIGAPTDEDVLQKLREKGLPVPTSAEVPERMEEADGKPVEFGYSRDQGGWSADD